MIQGTVLVTGATGLIGKAIVRRLLSGNVTVVASVRNKEKAVRLFGEETARLKYLVGDVTSIPMPETGIDYIIHAAGETSSRAFVTKPVETVLTGLQGTGNMLELARAKKVRGFVYLSSMEVYGAPSTDEKITENHGTDLDPMNIRSGYPENKRMCENLCASYAAEFGVPAAVIRLAQTFGPGAAYDDGRVFAEFARCAVEGRDIVLHTKGETMRSYLFTEDAVSAILTVLEKGTPGEAYNAANEKTYCSIYDMARLVADRFSKQKIQVLIREEDTERMGYAPVLHMNLDSSKLNALGWTAKTGLEEMYRQLIEGWRS